MQIHPIHNNYNNLNKHPNKPTFGKIIFGEQTIDRVSNLVSPEYADSLQALGKYYTCDLKKILDYDNATPDKKKILDSIFAKMPKEEVEDLTLYCEASNKQLDNSLDHIIDIDITTKYPELMSVYSYKKMLHVLDYRKKSGNFLYDNYIENYNNGYLEDIRKDGINISNRDTTVPLPNVETIYNSIKKIFNDKYLGRTKDNAKISLKLPTKEELNQLVSKHGGIKPEEVDFWDNALQFAKPTLEHYAQSYNIEITPSKDSWDNKILKVIMKSKKSSDMKSDHINVGRYHPDQGFDTPEGAGTTICNKVKTWTGIIEEEEACDGNSYYYEIHPEKRWWNR